MPCPNCHCPSCLALVGSPIPSTEFSPPSSELMTANRAPTNSEVAHSQDVISSSEKMISVIQGMADDLEKRKAELLGLISTHKTAISPLRSFPPELLAEIFSHTVSDHWNPKCPPPLALMGICSRWRRIILDTPRLWTKISSLHPMIDSWITRSKELPLHLGLDLSQPISHLILDALIPHSHCWESANIRLGPSSPILARVGTHLRSLKRLHLSFSEPTEAVDFFEVAPQLTHIMLTNAYEPIIITLPWEQLRVCMVDSSEAAHYVLQNANNLQGLHLDLSKVSDLPWFRTPGEPHSHHLRLENLIVEWKYVDPDINSFFSSITLPSLRILEICFDYPEYSVDPDEADANQAELALILAAFFRRSCAHLKRLKLTEITISQSGLIRCLSFAPFLVSLDIQFSKRWHAIDKKLLRSLDASHPGYILPHHRSLALRGPIGIFAGESLSSLIASRRYIDPKHDWVALLENLTLGQCLITQYMPMPFQFYSLASYGLKITYGKDWVADNLTQDDDPAPRPEIYFSEKLEFF